MSIPPIEDCKLCFIGGGNMAAAIVAGLLANGISSPDNITVSDPSDATRHKAETTLGVRTTASNLEAARDAHVLVLAVKPQVARAVCVDLASSWDHHVQQDDKPWPLVVSIVGGVTLTSLARWLALGDGRAPKVVRVMPNTPALLGEGASGAFAGAGVSADEKGLVAALLSGFSKVTEWVGSEELIDVVTGVSGTALRLPPYPHPHRRFSFSLSLSLFHLSFVFSTLSICCVRRLISCFVPMSFIPSLPLPKIWTPDCHAQMLIQRHNSHRIRTGLLFRNGRAHDLECYGHGIAPRAGRETCKADLSRRREDAGGIGMRLTCTATQERH